MERILLKQISKYLGVSLVLVVILTFVSCGTTMIEEPTEVTTPSPEGLSLKPNSLEFSLENDRISFVVIIINSTLDNNFYFNRARISDNDGMEATIQALNSMDIYPKGKSYQYHGGDSPEAMINIFDKKRNKIDSVHIYEDLALNEMILRYDEKHYRIDSSEIDKLNELCEQYKSDS